MNTWEQACEENRKQKEFVQAYVLEHYGPDPDDPVLAQSKALEAYWNSLGYTFGPDEETFILPD